MNYLIMFLITSLPVSGMHRAIILASSGTIQKRIVPLRLFCVRSHSATVQELKKKRDEALDTFKEFQDELKFWKSATDNCTSAPCPLERNAIPHDCSQKNYNCISMVKRYKDFSDKAFEKYNNINKEIEKSEKGSL